MIFILECFFVPMVAFGLWRIAYSFRSPEYDKLKRKHPSHYL